MKQLVTKMNYMEAVLTTENYARNGLHNGLNKHVFTA